MIDKYMNENNSNIPGRPDEGADERPRFIGCPVGGFPKCPNCSQVHLKEVSPTNNKVLVCTSCSKMFNDNGDGTITDRSV